MNSQSGVKKFTLAIQIRLEFQNTIFWSNGEKSSFFEKISHLHLRITENSMHDS